MKKQKRCMALAAALTMSLAISSTALAAVPSDIGGHWAQGTIIQWTSKGYISGYEDGTFKPDNSITRAEFVRLVNQSMGYTKTGNAYFSDVSSSYWGYNDIQKGVAAGYVRGDGNGKFRPNDPVSRQEAAVMISQICGLGQDFSAAAKYTDYRYIPSWAAGYVGAVSKAGIMSGYPDGDFKGDRYLSRAEAVIALDKALNYNASTTDDREVLKNYKLTDTSLKDKIIQGDLTISSSLSKKDVVLDNVKVEGSIIVEGGKTITAKNCEINNLEMSTSDATFDATGKTTVKKTTFEKYGKLTGSGYSKVVIDEDFNDYVTLDAQIEEVELDEETNIKLLSDCVIDSFTATKNADNATINFNSAKVKNMYLYDAVRITGKGDIRNMTVYESGVKSSIKPDDLTTKNGASKPTYTENSSGDITWGGGSSRYDDLTASKDGKTYRGGKYDDVKVTGYNVTLDDMTIYGDLTIDDDVREGSVDLEDVTIKGNVYIEGGGENSVTFEDCEISGNIYVRKSYKNDPVAVEFDNYTAKHIDGKVVISKNGAIIKESKNESGAIIDNIEVKTSSEVVIGTDVKNLDVMTKTSNLTINSGSDITKLTVSTNAKGSTFTVKGKVKEIYTNVDITVNGSGTVEKTSGSGTVNGISVTGVKLDKTTAQMKPGETLKLTATVEPPTATNQNVTWTTNNDQVATVNDGVVTAVGEGTTTITVTAEGNHTASCTVTVSPATVAVTGVSLNEGVVVLDEGGTRQLTATITPSNATDKSLSWSSNKESIATVDSNGLITAVAPGEATITVSTVDGGKSATCTVKVNASKVTGVRLDETSANMTVGETTTLKATVEPATATNKAVTWSSNKESVATVDSNGKVTAVAPGEATITVTAEGNHTATCKVTVNAATVSVTGVSLNEGVVVLDEGGTRQLTATITPSNATDKSLSWSSNKESIATVDSNGLITAVAPGEATITVSTVDGGKSATCTVKVNASKVTGVRLDETSANMTVGETTTLKATVEPATATNKAVTWSTSNDKVATVNGGVVTAVGEGTTTITVTAEGNHTASCTVNVSESLESAKAELTTLLSKYAVKDQNTLTAGGYKLVIPTVTTADEFNNVTPGSMYVNASNVAALNKAISDAYNVLNTSNDVTVIKNEITNFNNIVNGINGAPGLVGVKPTVTLL